MEAVEQCLPVELFIVLYKVVLSFESVNEILQCDCSNESYRASWMILIKIEICEITVVL